MNGIDLDLIPFKPVRLTHTDSYDSVMAAVELLAHSYTNIEKMSILRISYESILEAKKAYENHVSSQLITLINSKLIDRESGQPFKLADILDYSELDYTSTISFIRMLKNGTTPMDHMVKMIEIISDNYMYKN